MKDIRVLWRLMEGIRDARSRDLIVTAVINGVCKQQFSQLLLTSLMQFRFVGFVPKRLNFATYPQGFYLACGRDSAVGIATSCGLGGPGIESRWGWDFPHPSRPTLGPTLYDGYRVFPGGKAAGAWCWPPTPMFGAEVLNRVQIYLYLP